MARNVEASECNGRRRWERPATVTILSRQSGMSARQHRKAGDDSIAWPGVVRLCTVEVHPLRVAAEPDGKPEASRSMLLSTVTFAFVDRKLYVTGA